MAKWFGTITYGETKETSPGVWEEVTVDHDYYGDVVKNTRRLQSTDQLNDNITVTNEISIVSDPFANQNFHSMKYATFMGSIWKITNVEVQYPRLILSLGGVRK